MKDTTNHESFLCDTYALIEIAGGNKNYKKYIGQLLLTTALNIMELYYAFLRDYDKKTADYFFDLYSDFLIPIPLHVLKGAMEIKLKHKNEKLSYVDCVGYALAIERNVKFLTGDQKFQNKENVEFVK